MTAHGKQPAFLRSDPLLSGDAASRDLLTPPEAADILGVSHATVVRWMGTGYLPFVRQGRPGVCAGIVERAVVELMAEHRAFASKWLNWRHPDPDFVAALVAVAQHLPDAPPEHPALFELPDDSPP